MRRSKTTSSSRNSKSTSAISSPPKAALATAKRFNDMLHPRSSKERDRVRRVSDSATTRHERVTSSLDEDRTSEDKAIDGPARSAKTLEQALATALEEQNTMREELTRLKEHEAVSRDMVENYKRQLAGTHQLQSPPGALQPDSRPASVRTNSYESDTVPGRSPDWPHERLETQNEILRSQVAQLQDQLMTQEATYQSILEQRKAQDHTEWETLTARLHVAEKESQERLQQLLSLKSAFSSLTRVESQVTDSELSEKFSHLSNRIREWVINNFRRTKLDVNNIPPDTARALEEVLLDGNSVASSDRLALFQAFVSRIMMHIFREPLFVGLPESGPTAHLREVAMSLQNTGTDYQTWRHATITCLQKSEARHDLEEARKQQMRRLAKECISSITPTCVPAEVHSALENILNAAADFHTTLVLQKAQYQVHFFRNQSGSMVSFDDIRMEPVNELDDYQDDEGDIVVDRTFTFCVFPCLEKFGDEHGRYTEVSNVLVKANVCCSVN